MQPQAVCASSLPEPVAGAAHGVKKLRLSTRCKLRAQAADIDFDDVGRGVALAIEQRVFDHRPGEKPLCVAHEVLQKRALASSQIDLAVCAPRAARTKIERQIRNAQLCVEKLMRAAPQNRAKTCFEFAEN